MRKLALLVAPVALLVTLLVTLIVPAGVAAPTRSNWTPSYPVVEAQILHLAGTSIYCNVNAGPAVIDCFAKSASGQRNGYLIEATDKRVAVEPTGSSKPIFSESIKLPKSVTAYKGGEIQIGSGGVATVAMRRGYTAGIGQSHMTVKVVDTGLPMVVVSYFNGKHACCATGTYIIYINALHVGVETVQGTGKIVYQHSLR